MLTGMEGLSELASIILSAEEGARMVLRVRTVGGAYVPLSDERSRAIRVV